MTETPISVLIVEDDADSAYLIALALRRAGSFATEATDTLASARRRLIDGNIDVVVLDLNLPDSRGLATLHAIMRTAPHVTVVVVTAQPGEELALQALNLGAEDYLLKGQLDMSVLGRTVRHAYERRRIQAAFGQREEILELQETISFEQLLATISNRFITMSPGELDQAVHEALERIGAFFDVDRVALYEFRGETSNLHETHYWLAEQNPGLGVWPDPEEMPVFPHLNAHLDREGAFVANKIDDMPESWEAERRWAEVTGTKAGVIVRVELKNAFRGQVLLDSMWRPRQWAADVVQRLRMLGELIAATIVRQRAERDREQLVLRIQEQARVMQQLIETVPEGVVMVDAAGRILLANPAAEELLARLADTTAGDHVTRLGGRNLHELLASPPLEQWHSLNYGGANYKLVARAVRGDDPVSEHVLVIRDVTREREIQERAQQQDRLAAVGQLAAGVAHDFNNIMSVITLYASGTRYETDMPAELRDRLEIIQDQAKRASALIEQILDFGRRTPLETVSLNLVTFLEGVVSMLQRTLPENIEVRFIHPDQQLAVSADPTRMQQAIMNLAVNARDAMPEGGQLTIRLRELIGQPGSMPLPNIAPGTWLQLTVADTGSGISEAALPHIFEPFYTTKARGKGTGLGLAQLYGIVKQHSGEIDVQTQPGEGTSFHIFLPALPPGPETLHKTAPFFTHRGSGETILLVEDDDATRFALADTLEALGYHVLSAANGQEALTLYQEHGTRIALVLSDVVMPVMGGQALFHTLQEINPHAKIILLTGHAMDGELQQLVASGVHGWMRKPPRLEELARTVAAVLER